MYNEMIRLWQDMRGHCVVGREEVGMKESESKGPQESREEHSTRIVVTVPDHLYRAYHRCIWLLINETGKSKLQIMEEMVRDFLIKHGC